MFEKSEAIFYKELRSHVGTYMDWKCMFFNMSVLKKSFPFSLRFLHKLIIHSIKM